MRRFSLALLSVEYNKVQRIKHRIGAIFAVLSIKEIPKYRLL